MLLVNTDPSDDYDVRRGDRIAQLVIQRVEYVEWAEVDELDETDRDTFGFGQHGPLTPVPHDRKFRFGVLAKQARPAAEFRDLARQAEDLGFSTFFMPDHFVDHPLAPIPGIMAAAAATTTLRVGTLVLGNDYKHPVVLANEAATIDLLSDGRLELGVGAGWMTVDYEQGGFPLDSAGVRIARLDESLTVDQGPHGRRAVHVPRRALPDRRARR